MYLNDGACIFHHFSILKISCVYSINACIIYCENCLRWRSLFVSALGI